MYVCYVMNRHNSTDAYKTQFDAYRSAALISISLNDNNNNNKNQIHAHNCSFRESLFHMFFSVFFQRAILVINRCLLRPFIDPPKKLDQSFFFI